MTDLMRRLRSILAEHEGRTCTAAVLTVAPGNESPCSLACGVLDPEASCRSATVETPFDLASLSKAFTASAVLRLAASATLDLDGTAARFLPGFHGGGKELVTVRHLLTHASGLPPFLRLYRPDGPSPDPWAAVLACPLEYEPGSRVLYSDVGFMLLGRLVEVATGEPLPDAMRALVFDPLDVDARYGPVEGAPATELDPWRGRRVRGEVHDENCAVLGGACGHAGLFGSAADVLALARAYLHVDSGFLPPRLLLEARREQAATGDERRGLGWKLRSPNSEAPESVFSAAAFGHYGFTGTAVWVDPVRQLVVILLTNRVYFGRDQVAIRRLRHEVFAAVAESTLPSA